MKFGWNCSYMAPKSEDVQLFVRIAQEMERTGFQTFWYGEHIIMPDQFDVSQYPYAGFPSDNSWPDIYCLLAAAALVTKTIRLGTAVAIVPYRDPVPQAQAVATVDALSGGRFLYGAGVGWMREEFDALGVPFSERGARTTDNIRIMRALWRGENPDFESRFYTVPAGKLQPLPVAKPHPPIIVGGEGMPAMKRIAAYGDGWHFYHQPPAQLKDTLATLAGLMAEAGRDMAELDLSMAIDLEHISAHWHEVAEYEALGIRELVIRPPFKSVIEAHANVERLAEQLVAREARA